jgi:[acyl-carrier-protein] S-malonyltransferase
MTTIWLFPGQGTQRVGMARALCAGSPAAQAVFDATDEALGEPFSRLVFEGPSDELTLTANAQPAILAASIASLAALREHYPALPAPAFAAGHSLGEYSALVASGALDFKAAVRIVRLRGEAMQRAVAPGVGTMAAVLGGEAADVEELCAATRAELGPDVIVSPANFNAPGQIVIAGHTNAVLHAGKLAAQRRLKVVPLKVSAPFHCALMAPAARAVAEALAQVEFRTPSFPVVANVDAQPHTHPAELRELLIAQVDGAVRWHDSVLWMAGAGATHALEVGPGRVLLGLARKSAPHVLTESVSEPEHLPVVREFLSAVQA